jgi:hypothetical protein
VYDFASVTHNFALVMRNLSQVEHNLALVIPGSSTKRGQYSLPPIFWPTSRTVDDPLAPPLLWPDHGRAGVVELADTADSKSAARKGMGVQVPPPVFKSIPYEFPGFTTGAGALNVEADIPGG